MTRTVWIQTGTLLAIAVLALACRYRLVTERPLAGYADNEDAASHVLATCQCYDSVSPGIHRYLPIFTFGGGANQWIDDLPSASRFDKWGNCYYTSFPPGAFIAAYGVAKLTNLEMTPAGLRVFNVLLSVVAAFLLGLAVWQTTDEIVPDRVQRLVSSACAALVMFASPESLKSYTIGYWAQQLYQPVLLIVALQVARRKFGWLYYLCLAVGPLVEWSSFPAAIGASAMCGCCFLISRERKYLVHMAMTLALTALMGVLLVSWYAQAIGLREYFEALAYRSKVRAGSNSAWIEVVYLWGQSLGVFLIMGVLPFTAILSQYHRWGLRALGGRIRRIFREQDKYLKPVLFLGVMFAALAENFLMSAHAINYSYDRLKFVALFGYATSLVVVRSFNMAFAIAALAALVSIFQFWMQYDHSCNYTDPEFLQYKSVGEEIRFHCPADTLPFLDDRVRGHHLYYARRNIVEMLRTEHAQQDLGTCMIEECRRLGYKRARFYEVNPDGSTTFTPLEVPAPEPIRGEVQ